jgi:general nucleoside transport system ATP-binding protein
MTNEATKPNAIEATGIDKWFGAVHANRKASLVVPQGEIHAVVGENGAGKSTLMRVLSGMYAPDSGTVLVNGNDVTGWSTAQAIAAGVGMVHQHFMLVPTLTVAENVVLGSEPKRGLSFDHDAAVRAVQQISEKSGLRVNVNAVVGDLSVGEAQRVEILKTLYRGARILILDEPTAVLTPPEVTDLWDTLRQLQADGATIVLITHKLDEVIAVSENITVMRRGETVGTLKTAGTTPSEIARAMVGREVALPARDARGAPPAHGRSLHVRDLVVQGPHPKPIVDHVSFDVAPSEILGIAGVEGNGQTELIEAIAGLRRADSGAIRIDDVDLTNQTVLERFASGLAHIPEDRHERGLVLDYSIADNLILGAQEAYASRFAIDNEKVASFAQERIATYDIRPTNKDAAARTLSGGNQQKIVIAREFSRNFDVLLAVQPTRGVDVGAIEMIHARLREARDEGKAVLLVSADLNEVFALADRIAVMYSGKIVAILNRDETNEETVGEYMTGASA